MVAVKWYEEQAAQEWIADEITVGDIAEAENILSDELMMNLAACCAAAHEGCDNSGEFNLRVNQILADKNECHSAAMLLVYHNAMNSDAARHLLQKQHLRNHFYENNNTSKENIMSEQQTGKPLTEKQIEFAKMNKQKVLNEVDEFKQYLQKQENPQWWLKRRFFSFAANSFNKHKREQFQQQNQQQSLTTANEQTQVQMPQQSGQKI